MEDSKSIFASYTFWGAVVAVAAPIAGEFGVEFDQAAWANALVSLAGGLVAVWGRIRATKRARLV